MTAWVDVRTASVKVARRLVIAVLAGCLLTAATAATASARSTRVTRQLPVTRGSGYVALGDSVPFGYQEPQVVPPPDYLQASSFQGYPEQLGATLHLKVVNLACPGETSASLINASAPSNGCENAPPGSSAPIAYRRTFPLHVRYRGSQLAYAVSFLRRHPNVRLVSLTIGANDLFLCQGATKDHCTSPTELPAVLTEISRNVRRTLSTIRHRAHYGGQLAIVDYYSTNYASASADARSLALDHVLNTAAKPFGAVIADGYQKLRVASQRSAGNPCLAGLLTQLGAPGTCGIHPSYAGQALLAEALASAIRV